ncbi:KPN_02809 family neutral zinc metallopeptidase [Celeribacter sp. ULVN23_4]
MKWQGRRGSRNIEDRRRMNSGKAVSGAGGIGLLAIVVIGYMLGIDVTPLLEGTQDISSNSASVEITESDERAAQFVSVTLADTEEIWTEVFSDQLGGEYIPPILVLYKGVTQSPCGSASGATGPFYCPSDQKVYLDTDFFTMMERKLGAGGDFAQAYVVAHEVAHHVQNELGILGQANAYRAKAPETESNAVSVMIELQADCYSGIWAKMADEKFGSIEHGDIREALNAAKQIGDDTLQKNAGRVPQPHTFTHGTSDQRQRWFATGYKNGSLSACDTFSASKL